MSVLSEAPETTTTQILQELTLVLWVGEGWGRGAIEAFKMWCAMNGWIVGGKLQYGSSLKMQVKYDW